MKNITTIIAAAFAVALLNSSCSKEDEIVDPGIQYNKIDRISSGFDLQTATPSTDFTWVGERLTKVEEIDGTNVYQRTEISYVGSSNTQIAEMNIYATPEIDKSKSLIKAMYALKMFYKSKNVELEHEMKIVPTYTNNKATRLDIYAENFFDKTLPHVAYIAIDYTGDNPVKMSIRVLNPMVGISEIEIMQSNAIWSNGNITTFYTKMLNFEDITQGYITIDSTLCLYDDKINAFSSAKAYPMIAPELNSRNNIVSQTFYGYNWMGTGLTQYGSATSVYTYNEENYPISSIETETSTELNETIQWVRKFDYLP